MLGISKKQFVQHSMIKGWAYAGSSLYAHMNEGGSTLTTRLTVFREFPGTALPLMIREILV